VIPAGFIADSASDQKLEKTSIIVNKQLNQLSFTDKLK